MTNPSPKLFRCRVLGSFKWECPNCHTLHARNSVHWRRASAKCKNCGRSYKVGFTIRPDDYHTEAFFAGTWDGQTTNRVGADGQPLQGQLWGKVEWGCPRCDTIQQGLNQSLTCARCQQTFSIRLLLWDRSKRYANGHTRSQPDICPYDWTLYVPKAVQPVSAQTLGEV